MNIVKLNTKGITHLVVLAVAVAVVIGGIGVAVFKASHHSTNLSNAATHHSSSQQSKLNSDASHASAITPAATPSASSVKPTTTTKSPAKTTGSSGSSSSSTTQTQTTPPPPPPTPVVTCLTTAISNLDNGASVNITSSAVTVPGPVGDATARPIVFSCNGQSYFAYHQGSAANFNTPAATTANTMAYPAASGSYTLTQAHLDKAGNLVDEDENGSQVGYSTY